MCSKEKVVEPFIPWLRDWYFCVSDSIGFSDGLVLACGPNFKPVSLMITPSNIILDVEDYSMAPSF
jgi:hypothetical protein